MPQTTIIPEMALVTDISGGAAHGNEVPHDVVTHHAGEREDGEVAMNLFGATSASQPNRIMTSAMMAYLRSPGDAGFAGSAGQAPLSAQPEAERNLRIGGAGQVISPSRTTVTPHHQYHQNQR